MIKHIGVYFGILYLLIMLILIVIRVELILGSSYVPDSCKVLCGCITFALEIKLYDRKTVEVVGHEKHVGSDILGSKSWSTLRTT